MNKLSFIAIVILSAVLSAVIFSSCAFLHAYSIVLTTEYDGNKVIENEKNVVLYLEDIIKNNGDYSMRAFDRKAISHKVKKTPRTTHAFYVIYGADETYHTLSFSATGKWATSKGAWAMDTETDIASYIDYLNGNNIWELKEVIPSDNGIDTLSTINNVLSKIRRKTTYYFRSAINKDDNHDNCYSALFESIVGNE